MKKSLVAILLMALGACSAVGPRTITGARFNYNEEIVKSADDQLLLNLVRLQYRDTPLFLEINSVTASYSASYNVGIAPSISNTRSPRGGIMATAAGAGIAASGLAGALGGGRTTRTTGGGLSLGGSFAEAPTISYSPLQGQNFAQQLLTPITPAAILLLSQSGWSISRVMRLCVQELSGVYNAPSASGPTPSYVPRYKEFQELTAALRRLQVAKAVELGLHKAKDEAPAIEFRFNKDAKTAADIKLVLKILNVSEDGGKGDKIVFAHDASTGDETKYRIRTRSLLGVLHYLSQAVEAPKRHRESGRVTNTLREDGSLFDWSDVTGDLLRIQSAETIPVHAYVRIHYRGTWFFIDDRDLNSKSTFQLLSNLISLHAGEITGQVPLLTLAL